MLLWSNSRVKTTTYQEDDIENVEHLFEKVSSATFIFSIQLSRHLYTVDKVRQDQASHNSERSVKLSA